MRKIFLMAALGVMGVSDAQIALPPVKLPEVRLPEVGRTVSGVADALGQQGGVEARLSRTRELLRRHRDWVEADPHGQPVVRAELLAFSPSPAALERAQAAGFTVIRRRVLESLAADAAVVVLRGPAGLSTRRALRRLKALDRQGIYDFNHIYLESGEIEAAQTEKKSKSAGGLPAAGTKIGLIDGGVDLEHPVFRRHALHSRGCSNRPIPSAHGTAVASLMAGHSDAFRGAAAGAELYAADVYCGLPTGGAVDALADAFGWLSREQVTVINVSLVGPSNALLENIVRLMTARGHLIVAAVGNDGPNSPPLYPAAYPGVIGVTGVDSKRRVLLEAVRGRQVMFAAPGADLRAATVDARFAAVRGTSFAAPIVAGLLATSSIAQLSAQAVDLGARGFDTTYGNGLVGEQAVLTPME